MQIGLAVGDTNKQKEKAEFTEIEAQVRTHHLTVSGAHFANSVVEYLHNYIGGLYSGAKKE